MDGKAFRRFHINIFKKLAAFKIINMKSLNALLASSGRNVPKRAMSWQSRLRDEPRKWSPPLRSGFTPTTLHYISLKPQE